uniref:TPR_REGION domain-containing protein n=1 Tax=Syphacia muris TaxID=451379 RepID=A0A0N5AB37_9BILA
SVSSHEESKSNQSSSISVADEVSISTQIKTIDKLIKKYLQTSQRKTALFWIDKRFSLCQSNVNCASFIDMAEFLKVIIALSAVDEWTRIITFVKQNDLIMKHVVFAYYYVNALYHRKLYEEILKLKLNSLVNVTNSYFLTFKLFFYECIKFKDCLLVHIATLVLLQKHQDLFILGHKLVDTLPDNELSWYTVGCYYYSIRNYALAKNFFNKCTMMKPSFGEGWLAFGHVLTAESEHEQATNCYLRASRVHEGCFEPFMYAGLEYAYANSIKLAQEFLKDSAEHADQNALVLHEQACIFYMNKDYDSADEYFTKALKVAYGFGVSDKVDIASLLHLTLSNFWEPLINNLAHIRRRKGKHDESLKFYQKSLTMRPRNAAALCGMAATYASLGEFELAVRFFNDALGVSPQNQLSIF